MKNWKKLMVIGLLAAQVSSVYADTEKTKITTKSKNGYSLDFDTQKYMIKTVNVDGKEMKYRAFENIVYVSNPVDTKYQIMNFYVPELYYVGKKIGKYSAETAPIFFPNTIGGYMPAEPGTIGKSPFGSQQVNAATIALSKGYVVAQPGARGRTTKDENGKYTGKAPSCIVDLKAAVSYLHYNDKVMLGDAEKIISNGTSAGGALSVLLGATGDNKDYKPYLKTLGAADARDDIFAVSAYCPITNLDNADMAYEWLFNGVYNYKKLQMNGMIDFNQKRTFVEGTMSQEQIKLSKELSAMFPEYINSLKLTKDDGTILNMNADGSGSFKEYLKSYLIASAQKALNSGTDLSDLKWVTVKDKTVTDIDFSSYVNYIGRMKLTPAFDGVDLSSGENDLFGTADIQAQHFTKFSKNSSTVNGSMADANLIKIMNPMNYIGDKHTKVSKYWRIRHGGADRDTSLAIPVIVATTLKNRGFNVDFAVPWNVPHSGDYDLEELFSWMDRVCK